MNTSENTVHSDTYLKTIAIFGSAKRTILSKDFKGGYVQNFCGATEIDLTHADLCGMAELYIDQLFSETKIIIPSDWTVHVELSQIAGQLRDKRSQYETSNPNKVLVLQGTSVAAEVKLINSGIASK
jgi:predicted membrane protein